MQCANCERPTPETAVFCNHCGTRLVETCRACSSHNPLDSKFCHVCGIQLSEAPPENYDQGQSSPPHPPASEDPPTANRAPEDTSPVTSVGHISSDLKDLNHAIQNLATDVVSYSTPRIISFSKRVKTLAAAAVAAGTTQYKELVDRLKSTTKKYPTYTNPELRPRESFTEAKSEHAARAPIHCPRCRHVIEPDSRYCFSCGLPIDERYSQPRPNLPNYGSRDVARWEGIPAGFWIRLAAWFIDLAVVTVAEFALIGVWPGFDSYFDENSSYFHWVDLVAFVGIILYYTIAVSVWQTTIGKRLLGLYVLRADGVQDRALAALGRYFAGMVSALPFGIGYLMIGLRSDKRGLHDLICDTAVVKIQAYS